MASTRDLVRKLNSLDGAKLEHDDSRVELEQALFRAWRRLQTPWAIALDQGFTQPMTVAAIKTLIDAQLWSKWIAKGGEAMTCADLGQLSGVDPLLLKRLFRHLSNQQLIQEDERTDKYSLTPYSRALAEPSFASVFTVLLEYKQPLWMNFPHFAAETGFKNPCDSKNSNFTSWTGESDPFVWMSSRPRLIEAFGNVMTVFSASKASWVDIYPTETIVNDYSSHSKVAKEVAFVVDVGGNMGHDLEKLRAKHPNLPVGSLVLQDLEAVINKASVVKPIKKQAIDMFVEQPVKGAYIYYLHSVLHDWPDKDAVKVLQVLKEAMEPKHSKVLIHESIIADTGADPRTVMSDLVMMMTHSATERDWKQWESVIRESGLKVKHVYGADSPDSIIELVLP